MGYSFLPVFAILAAAWFVVFWLFGGVFFAAIALMRLERIRHVRFSCLYSLLALALSAGCAFFGIQYGHDSIERCLSEAATKTEAVTAIFGCGFAAVFTTFLVGVVLMLAGGFVIMTLSRAKSEPWIRFHEPEEDESEKKTFFKS